jgi:hypothetical protein
VGNFIHGYLKLTLLLSHMLKINKNRKMLHIYKLAQKLKIKRRKRRKSDLILKHYYFLFFLLPLFSGGWYWWSDALYRSLYYDCAGPPLNCFNGEGDQFDSQCLWSLPFAFVGWSAMKTSWGTCTVEDVVAWLPHSPMLAFDILQNMVEALIFLHKAVALWSLHVFDVEPLLHLRLRRMILLQQFFLFILLCQHKRSFL